MTLLKAIEQIDKALCKLDNTYGRPVFDEWAVISDDARMIFHYSGQREDRFSEHFHDDMMHLKAEMDNDKQEPETGGEFGFTREGKGSSFDAYICLGPRYYLVCNNTRKCMEQLTSDPSWVKAQGIFVDLSHRFAFDPVEA